MRMWARKDQGPLQWTKRYLPRRLTPSRVWPVRAAWKRSAVVFLIQVNGRDGLTPDVLVEEGPYRFYFR